MPRYYFIYKQSLLAFYKFITHDIGCLGVFIIIKDSKAGLKQKELAELVNLVLAISQEVLYPQPKSLVIKIVHFIKDFNFRIIISHFLGLLVALSLFKLVSLQCSNSFRHSYSQLLQDQKQHLRLSTLLVSAINLVELDC